MMSYITRVSATSKRLAEDKGYDFILSYQIGQNVFYASPLMDVTNDIVELMNADYRESTGVSDSADGGPITNIENATENE
jgi:outer membrane protein